MDDRDTEVGVGEKMRGRYFREAEAIGMIAAKEGDRSIARDGDIAGEFSYSRASSSQTSDVETPGSSRRKSALGIGPPIPGFFGDKDEIGTERVGVVSGNDF